jgi:hypothetical protein
MRTLSRLLVLQCARSACDVAAAPLSRVRRTAPGGIIISALTWLAGLARKSKATADRSASRACDSPAHERRAAPEQRCRRSRTARPSPHAYPAATTHARAARVRVGAAGENLPADSTPAVCFYAVAVAAPGRAEEVRCMHGSSFPNRGPYTSLS